MTITETNNIELSLIEVAEIDGSEMESIAAHLPVRSNVGAGVAAVCCTHCFRRQHILNTTPYESDCRRLSGSFVHHLPSSGAKPGGVQRAVGQFLDTWLCYKTVF